MSSGNGVDGEGILHTTQYGPVLLTPIPGTEFGPSPAASILAKAADLVDGDRDKQHGNRHECHAAIAALWSAFLAVNIEAEDVALMMALLKIARTQHGEPDPDNYIDGVGYIALAGELAGK